MALQHTRVTAEDFERFIVLPENEGRDFEFIGGEIFEVVSNSYCSLIGARIVFLLTLYLRDNKIEGYVSGADGGYIVSGERYMPDVGYISKARQPKPSHDAYNPFAPDFAVEVFSPTDSKKKLTDKVVNYLAAGTLVLAVYPDDKTAAVYAPGKAVQQLGSNDVFDGGEVLPGLNLPVRDMFPEDE
jgi:Uma2 family endonuclease